MTPWNTPGSAKTALPESDNWNVHAQTTFLPQGYPSFRSPYAGANSLPGSGQTQATWTTTAFLGVRLWQGGEFYFNPELAQGFGLNGTLGLAGFPERRSAKGRRRLPEIPRAALLHEADVRSRRRAGRRRRRPPTSCPASATSTASR